MFIDNLENWIDASIIYAESKEENIYSKFCKVFADEYFNELDGFKILDAGCGDGEYTKMFFQKGAVATGCDGSYKVIELAKTKYPFCQFDIADLSAHLPYEDNYFDLVFSNLVLMDIDPIDTVIKEFSRVLKPRRNLFFSIMHPVFYLSDWELNEEGVIIHKMVSSYLSHKCVEQAFGTQPVFHYHRPISFYLNILSENGFILSKMLEPNVYESKLYKGSKKPDIPLYLFVDLIKA
ncbi:MAG: class I SAM-dependent methyltransferase [Oscillospiraceae bacterium]|nr:class I SAM-dependent methyltransferase [Oscillospiraceae bacterium]